VAKGKKKKPIKTKRPAPKKARGKIKTRKPAKIAAKKNKTAVKPKAAAATGLPAELLKAALQVLKDRQASEIVTVSLAGRSSMADYLIIASGRAGRQIAAIADYLREAFMKLGARSVRIEGLPEANWVLVDAGDVVVHLFRPEVRNYYRLEDIWTK
jgi:ribosome-associated protein